MSQSRFSHQPRNSQNYKSQFADLFLTYSSDHPAPYNWKDNNASSAVPQRNLTKSYNVDSGPGNKQDEQLPQLVEIEDHDPGNQAQLFRSQNKLPAKKSGIDVPPNLLYRDDSLNVRQNQYIAKCTQQLAASKQEQEKLERQIEKWKKKAAKDKELETMVENITERNRQLQFKISTMSETIKQLESTIKSQIEESQRHKSTVLSLQKEITVLQLGKDTHQINKQMFASLEGYMKKLIGEFVQEIKSERMTKKLENKIQSFLQTLLQINSEALAQNKENKNTQLLWEQPSEDKLSNIFKTANKNSRAAVNPLSYEEDSRISQRDVSPSSLSVAGVSRITPSIRSSNLTPAAKFSVVRHSVDRGSRDLSVILNSGEESKSREVGQEDRGRSKSQRRRKIFQ